MCTLNFVTTGCTGGISTWYQASTRSSLSGPPTTLGILRGQHRFFNPIDLLRDRSMERPMSFASPRFLGLLLRGALGERRRLALAGWLGGLHTALQRLNLSP